jgi:hypothetical protein
MFCKIIREVGISGLPDDVELFLFYVVADPVKPHVHGFGAFFFTVAFAIPSAVVLSVVISVGSCFHARSSRVFRTTVPSFPLTKRPANWALAAEETT